MPAFTKIRRLPYTPEQLFDLVADVDHYPEFLPWCTHAAVRQRRGSVYEADMAVGFKMIRENFTSRVVLDPPRSVDVTHIDGPFRYLHNRWDFEPCEEGTQIRFFIDFEFRSRMLRIVMGALFQEAVGMMIFSFERRARQLYGVGGRLAVR